MCEICGHIPCHPRCPNADEDTPVKSCNHCSEDIYENDTYYQIDGLDLCEDCFEEHVKNKYSRTAERECFYED